MLQQKRLWLCLLLLVNAVLASAADSTVISLTNARKVVSNTELPPDFSQSETIALPDDWEHDQHGFYGSVWYQLRFPYKQTRHRQMAIYLSDINMNAELWLNGVLLGSGGSMYDPLSRYWHAPLMLVFSSTDLREMNDLRIHVVAYANEFGHLGVVKTGPLEAVAKQYNKDYFTKVTIHVFSGALSALYAFFMMLVWWKRKDPVFFWGALVCAFWSFSSINLYATNIPVADLLWEKIIQTSIGWIPILFFFFILRLEAVAYRRNRDGMIIVSSFIFSMLVLLSPEKQLFLISNIWHLYAMLFGVVGVVYIFYCWLRYRRYTQFLMLIAFVLIAICGVHDIFVQNQLLQNDKTLWLDYSIPVILFLIGYLIVSRFLMAVETSERLNAELESRVQRAQEKIESTYKKILLLETEQASNRERERIYRDMHDDMGAKLLSLVYKAESEEMSALARSAINDLRAIVSRKPGQKHRLSDVLEKWQQSCRRRSTEAGFQLYWKQNPVPDSVVLNSEYERHLQRIQSEVLTNIIKHSKGNRISVTVMYRFNCLYCSVQENGDYSRLQDWQEGRGISNIRHRVAQMSGRVHWWVKSVSAGGVSWLIPLSEAAG